MAFRERMKKAFKKASPGSSVSKSSSEKGLERWPSNVYKPGEPMPRPKYRAPVKKEHKEKLEAFSFSEAWRRRSFVSEYSPMGTRMPSRRASLTSRKSFGGRSVKSRRNSVAMSRKNSVSGGTKSGRQSFERPEHGAERPRYAARATTLSAEIENEGDDDITNVGLSRVHSRDDQPRKPVYSRRHTGEYKSRTPVTAVPAHLAAPPPTGQGTDSPSPCTTAARVTDAGFAHDHTPFSEEELAKALSRVQLAIPAH